MPRSAPCAWTNPECCPIQFQRVLPVSSSNRLIRGSGALFGSRALSPRTRKAGFSGSPRRLAIVCSGCEGSWRSRRVSEFGPPVPSVARKEPVRLLVRRNGTWNHGVDGGLSGDRVDHHGGISGVAVWRPDLHGPGCPVGCGTAALRSGFGFGAKPAFIPAAVSAVALRDSVWFAIVVRPLQRESWSFRRAGSGGWEGRVQWVVGHFCRKIGGPALEFSPIDARDCRGIPPQVAPAKTEFHSAVDEWGLSAIRSIRRMQNDVRREGSTG